MNNQAQRAAALEAEQDREADRLEAQGMADLERELLPTGWLLHQRHGL
jgi:hypothetical protein